MSMMRQVYLHIIPLGCLRRGLYEENEMSHKAFKAVYKFTNKTLDSLGPQLLTSWLEASLSSSQVSLDIEKGFTTPSPPSLPPTFISDANDVVRLCGHLSGRKSNVDVAKALSSFQCDGLPVWKQHNSVPFQNKVVNYSSLTHTALFGGDEVYGK